MAIETPVLIVGGGPVGLALAADLGWRGIPCILVEQGDGTIYHPRANTVNSRTMEFCRRWGIAEEVRNSGAPPDFPPTILYVTGLNGYEIARIERPTHGGNRPLATTPERSQRCNQIWFDPILRRHAERFPTTRLRYRTRFESFAANDEGVIATVRDLTSDKTETIAAQYLVSCCGGHSVVPQALGVRWEGEEVLGYHLNVFLRIKELWTLHGKGKAAFYFFLNPVCHNSSLIEIDGNELWRLGLNLGLERKAPEDVDVAGICKSVLGPNVRYEIISELPWTCRSIVADRWRKGRVLLAGDAVHQHGPSGGFGMNTGMGDAVDLGWKLAAMVEGWGGAALLDSYERERRPVAQRVVDEVRENMSNPAGDDLPFLAEASPRGDAARTRAHDEILRDRTRIFISDGIALGYRYDDSPVVVPDGTPAPKDSVSEYVQTSRPGSRAPHAFLDGRSTIDFFGRGFVLMALKGAGPEAQGLEAAARARRVPLQRVEIADEAVAALYERRLVLVRPDGHVAWRDDRAPEDAGALIDRVRGAA